MPSAPLGPLFKLERADACLQEMQGVLNSWAAIHPYAVDGEHDTEAGEYVYRLRQVTPAPAALGLLADEALYHMRSSLDHLVCALVSGKINGQAFPIFTVAPTGQEDARRWKSLLRGVSGEAQRVVTSLQPHKAGSGAKAHPLARLNQLHNAYKHSSFDQMGIIAKCMVVPGGWIKDDAAKLGDVFARIPDSADKADFEREMTLIPTFLVTAGNIVTGVAGLKEMHEFICDQVLPAFGPLFD